MGGVVTVRRVVAAVHGAVDPQALSREGVDPDRVLDFSSNRTPLGPSARVREAVLTVGFDAYPDPHAFTFRKTVAARHGLPVECVVAGNGSTELIRLLAQVTLEGGGTVLSLAFCGPAKLAAGGSDNLIRLWDLATRSEQYRLVGHTGSVTTLVWDAEASVLVSGSFDTTVRFWRLGEITIKTASRR